MKRKVYLNTRLTTFLGMLFLLSIVVFGFAICIRDLVEGTNPTIKYLYFVFPVFIIGALLLFLMFFIGVLQFVIVDEQKIVSRNAFYKMSEYKWEQIKEVKINSSKSKNQEYEIVFVSEKINFPDEDMEGEEVEDEDYITLIYSKKREDFLKQLKPDIKFIVKK